MPSPRKNSVTAQKDNDPEAENTAPLWDTSDTGRATHLRLLEVFLPTKHPEYVTLIEHGFVVEKGNVCCTSDNHIDRVRQGAVVTGNWMAPCIIGRNEYDDTDIIERDNEDLGRHQV